MRRRGEAGKVEQGTSKKENVANKGDVGVRKNEKRGKEKEGTVKIGEEGKQKVEEEEIEEEDGIGENKEM